MNWLDILKNRQMRRKPPVKLVGAIDSFDDRETRTTQSKDKSITSRSMLDRGGTYTEEGLADMSRVDLIDAFTELVEKLPTEKMIELLVSTQGDFSKLL